MPGWVARRISARNAIVTGVLVAGWLRKRLHRVTRGHMRPSAFGPGLRSKRGNSADELFQDQAGHSRPRLWAGAEPDVDRVRLQRRRSPDAKGASVDCAQVREYGDLRARPSRSTPRSSPPRTSRTSTRTSRSRSAPGRRSSTRAPRSSRRSCRSGSRPATRRTSPTCRSPAHCALSSRSSRTRSRPAPEEVIKNIDENFDPAWKEYGSVDGKLYAAPLGSNVKSFVWYSPSMFRRTAGRSRPRWTS